MINQSSPQILALALQLVSLSPNQQLYLSKLHHYQSLIQQSTNLKHQLLLSIKSQQIKQKSFQVVHSLVKQNNKLQQTVTRLEEEVVDKITELEENKKLRLRCVKLEDEVRRLKEEVEGVRELEETVGKIKKEIQEGLKVGEDVEKMGRRGSEGGDDPCGVLNRERDHILILKKIIESKRDEFELGYKITKEMNTSLNKRQLIQTENIQMMTNLLEKQQERSGNIVYKTVPGKLSQQEQQLMSNYQKQIISLKERNESLKQKVESLEKKLEEEKGRSLGLVQKVQIGKLELDETRIKMERLEVQLKESISIFQKLSREKSIDQINIKDKQKSEGKQKEKQKEQQKNKQKTKQESQKQQLITKLQNQNRQIKEQLKTIEQSKQQLQKQISQLKSNISLLTKQLKQSKLKSQQLQNEKQKEKQQNLLKTTKTISQQKQKQHHAVSNLQKQISLLDDTNKSLSKKLSEAEKQRRKLVEEGNSLKVVNQELKRSREELERRKDVIVSRVEDYSNEVNQMNQQLIEDNLNELNKIIHLITFQN